VTYRLTSIDPGAERCALACWLQDCTLAAVLDVGSYDWPTTWAAENVVVEVPQADGRAQVGDDVLRMALSATRVGARAALVSLSEHQPREWKGSLPKAVCHARAWAALSYDERELLGGDRTGRAIEAACARGAAARWKPHHNHYYRDRELPSVGGLKITHDILDAVAIGLWYLGRTSQTQKDTHESSRLDKTTSTLVVDAPAKRSRAKRAEGSVQPQRRGRPRA
jgi:hypothetical protein